MRRTLRHSGRFPFFGGSEGKWSLSGKTQGRYAAPAAVHSAQLCGLLAKHRVDCQQTNMAASAAGRAPKKDEASSDSPRSHDERLSPQQSGEIIKPTIMELTKEVRTNILCTVKGCGKILPNTPALNMHLVKSHRIKVQTLTDLKAEFNGCGAN